MNLDDIGYTPGPDVSVANHPLSALDHLLRLTMANWLDDGPPAVPFWWDCWVAFDIENTMIQFVENIVSGGARAVTIYQPVTILTKFKPVIETCQRLECAIVTARDPTFERKVWWMPG